MRLIVPRAAYRSQSLAPCPRRFARRGYALHAPSAPVFQVFNRRTKWLQKERAATNVELSRQADYIKDEIASRVCDRLHVRIFRY